MKIMNENDKNIMRAFVKDCIPVCTIESIDKLMDRIKSIRLHAKELPFYYQITLTKSEYSYLNIRIGIGERYMLKVADKATALYFLSKTEKRTRDSYAYAIQKIRAGIFGFAYNEPDIEQDGYEYNLIYETDNFANELFISIVDKYTRRELLCITNNTVWTNDWTKTRLGGLRNHDDIDGLPENIKKQITATAVAYELRR